jgi:hypothetical protein
MALTEGEQSIINELIKLQNIIRQVYGVYEADEEINTSIATKIQLKK